MNSGLYFHSTVLSHFLCDHPECHRLDADEASSIYLDHADVCNPVPFHHMHHHHHQGLATSTYEFRASQHDFE